MRGMRGVGSMRVCRGWMFRRVVRVASLADWLWGGSNRRVKGAWTLVQRKSIHVPVVTNLAGRLALTAFLWCLPESAFMGSCRGLMSGMRRWTGCSGRFSRYPRWLVFYVLPNDDTSLTRMGVRGYRSGVPHNTNLV